MKKINIGSNIKIYWKIWRGANKVTEDFNSMNTNLKVFLVGSGDTYYLEPSINNTIDPGYDVIELDIPAFRLDVGVYNIKAIWEKNGGRNVLTSARASVLYLTDSPSEAPIQDEEVRIVSLVESFGRDGMSAYETAVMRGVNEGITSEIEWVKTVSVFNEKERIANEEVRMANEAERIANEAERRVAEKRREWFKEGLLNQVNSYKPIEITGDVTNAADEEDITSDENNLLKLKDRTNINGMGYKILRMGKPLQEQMSLPNTIYEIRYNFVLDNGTLNIPEECILKYNGGSFSNGHIVYNNTTIVGVEKLNNVTFEGDVKHYLDDRISNKVGEVSRELMNEIDSTKSGLTEDIKSMQSSVTSQVARLADEEDLNSYQHIDGTSHIGIKDRGASDGKGYVILRKLDKRTGAELSFKEQITKSNTIYEVRYNFDLGGEDLLMPEDSILKFVGGCLYNGAIIGRNTYIDSPLTKIFGDNISLQEYTSINEDLSETIAPNSFVNDYVYPEWFGAVGDGEADDAQAINRAVKVGYAIGRGIKLSNRVYSISEPIIIGSGTRLEGDNVVGYYSTNTTLSVKNDCNAIEINNIKLFGNDETYYTGIYISNITLDGNQKGKNGIHYDGNEAGENFKVFQYCSFRDLHIRSFRFGMYFNLVNSKRDGFLYTDFVNVNFGENLIGLHFDGDSFINLNSFTKCYFSRSKLVGLRIKGSTLENNRFTDCSFEDNGNNYTDEILLYGSSGVSLIGRKGYNTFSNCYFEYNYPRKKTDSSIELYSSIDTDFYVANIVCQGVTISLLRNLFSVYYRGLNIGGTHCGLEMQFNDYWYPVDGLDGNPTRSFVKIYNNKFGTPQYGYQKLLFLDEPRPTIQNPKYAYEFEDISRADVDVINYGIVDRSGFEKTNHVEVDRTKVLNKEFTFYVDGQRDGKGFLDYSPMSTLEAVKRISYFNKVEKKTIIITGDCTSGTQDSATLTGDLCHIVSSGQDKKSLTFESYIYGWNVKTIIFENLVINLKKYQNFRLDGAETIIVKNCTIVFPDDESDVRFFNTYSDVFTNIYFDNCVVVANNTSAQSLYLAAGNVSRYKVNLVETTLPSNVKLVDRDNFDFYNQTSAISAPNGYIGYDSKIGAFVYKNNDVWSILPNVSYTEMSGVFENKPYSPAKGTSYFCTDRKVGDGSMGIVIYYKGDGIWVDALGREVV